MSKRTTPGTTPSENPAPRRRAAKAPDAIAATPKAPRARRKTSITDVIAAAGAMSVGSSPVPSHDEISRRAYFISLEQGADPLAAWLRAERELTTT